MAIVGMKGLSLSYLNAVLKAVQLPAGISDLDTGLTDVNRDALPHGGWGKLRRRSRV